MLPEHEYTDDDPHQVTLFQSNLVTGDCMKIFVAESMCSAILDSGATATVSGKNWMDAYVESLPTEKQELITVHSSGSSFKFGSGKVHSSIHKMRIPANIGKEEIFIVTDVVDIDIPMLLSKSSMKKAGTEINFKDDSVTMLGHKQNVVITSSGHYAIPLNEKRDILNDVCRKGSAIVLHIVDSDDKHKTAKKTALPVLTPSSW